MPTDTTLKPCPFCGGEARLREDPDEYFPVRVACDDISCMVSPEAAGFEIEDAAEAWNTRHEPLNGYWDDPDH